MSGHGIPRYSPAAGKSQEARKRELNKIEEYRKLDQLVHDKIAAHEYTPETLQKVSELLGSNPEYYTAWNYRRRLLEHGFSQAISDESNKVPADQMVALIKNDLQFLIPLLRRFPKCYWIWNYRLWLLNEAKRLLPAPLVRGFWKEELTLVGKMLNLDNRNFHGWSYRHFIVETLESLEAEDGRDSMAPEEFEYAKRMISTNLSNFSAWHYRTKLIQRLLDEKSASDSERRGMLDDELSLIHNALIDPFDQSLWFYHQNLMCVFDPSVSAQTMAPNLTSFERLEYLAREVDAIDEMLDGAEDCKYIYQALVYCTATMAKVRGSMASDDKTKILGWLSEIKKLDPLRHGRWTDFERSLEN